MNAPSCSFLALVVAVLLLLPSCVRWDIGQNIRECAETRVGVNPYERYACPADAPELASVALSDPQRPGRCRHVFLAPEVTYRMDSPFINSVPLSGPAEVSEVVPTGELRVVALYLRKPDGCQIRVGERYKGERAALTPYVEPEKSDRLPTLTEGGQNSHRLGCVEVRQDEGYFWYAAAAAPFDYLIDPALSLLSTPVFWGYAFVASFFSD